MGYKKTKKLFPVSRALINAVYYRECRQLVTKPTCGSHSDKTVVSLIQLVDLSPTPAPLGLGCDSHFVFLCRSVFSKNHTAPHTQATRAEHTIKVCYESKTDRSLARFGAVLPRGDNQSTRGMNLLVVSQLRFLGPVPFPTTAFPGQFPLAQLPLRAS